MFLSVDATSDLAEILTSRRARVTPEQAGLLGWGLRILESMNSPGGRAQQPHYLAANPLGEPSTRTPTSAHGGISTTSLPPPRLKRRPLICWRAGPPPPSR